jgi:hypothetical protein
MQGFGFPQTHISGLVFLDPEDVRTVYIWGPSGTSVEEQGSHELASDYGGIKDLSKGLGASGLRGLEPNH